MNGASHLLSRGSSYYFNRRIPDHIISYFADPKNHPKIAAELVDYFAGKKLVRYSLKTKDKWEAVKRCIEEDFKFSSYQAKVEQYIQDGTITYDTVSNQTIKGLAQVWLSRTLQDDEKQRLMGVTEHELENNEEGMSLYEPALRETLATGKVTDLVTHIATDLLNEFQIVLDRNGDQYRLLIMELVKAALHVFESIRGRNKGEVIETPPEPPKAAVKGRAMITEGGITLDDLKGYWEKQRKRNWKTVYDVETSIKEFKALHGDLTIDQVTKAQIIAYKDWLLGIGVVEENHKQRSARTIGKRLTMLKAVLQVAVDNDKLQANPAAGIKVPLPDHATEDDEREPFTTVELRKIFTSPVYAEGWRDSSRYAGGEAQFWIPLLMLYTGMRREETGQLLKADIQKDEGTGILFILTKAGNGKRLKTKESKRRIPIHPDLIDLPPSLVPTVG